MWQVHVLAAVLLAGRVLAESPPVYSELWGEEGELWDPAGPLPDFSFAGYRQGAAPLPSPPVTRSVLDFSGRGMSDTAVIQAALDWANSQPLTDEYIVLYLPPGQYEVLERLEIRRSRVVLRGAGRGLTKLYFPKSLTDVYGPSALNKKTGGYVNSDAFVRVAGQRGTGDELAAVTQEAAKGDSTVVVDDASGFKAGRLCEMLWQDKGGRFHTHLFDDLWRAPEKYDGDSRVSFHVRVLGVEGNRVSLERTLPYDIRDDMVAVTFHALPDTVTDSGVEGITFSFKWSLYAGHHLEAGWHALELSSVRDCWVRDVGTINADNSVVLNYATSVTVDGVRIEASKTRANDIPNDFGESADADGHWGVTFTRSADVLVRNFDVRCSLVHDVGTDTGSKWSVFADGTMVNGNLDLHRGLSGPTLYTNISVGVGTDALLSGGPKESGPNAVAGTTWWRILSQQQLDPNRSNGTAGSCSYGPSINLVGVDLQADQVEGMCDTWWYERDVNAPANLHTAQFERRTKKPPS